MKHRGNPHDGCPEGRLPGKDIAGRLRRGQVGEGWELGLGWLRQPSSCCSNQDGSARD